MMSLFVCEERLIKRDEMGSPLQVLDLRIDFAAPARAVDSKPLIGCSGRG